MNVYEVNGFWIAASNANEAFDHFLNETNFVDEIEFEDLEEDQEGKVTITVRRATAKEIAKKDIRCCEDGCGRCEERNDYEYYSLKDILDQTTEFPSTLARYT